MSKTDPAGHQPSICLFYEAKTFRIFFIVRYSPSTVIENIQKSLVNKINMYCFVFTLIYHYLQFMFSPFLQKIV